MSLVRLRRRIYVAAGQLVSDDTALEVINQITQVPVAIKLSDGTLISPVGRTVADSQGYIDVYVESGFPCFVRAYATDYASAVIALSADPSFVGLGNVDNTSDASKPVSTAQAASIATKVAKSTFTAKGQLLSASANGVPFAVPVGVEGRFLVSNPNVEAGVSWEVPDLSFFGLDNVDNTLDADKPVSTAQAAAIATKVGLSLYSAGKGILLVAHNDGSPYPFAAGADGQVLISDSTVDAGIRWANADLSGGVGGGGVDPALYTGKGVILGASAPGFPVSVPAGTDGFFLKADSTASAGVSWAALSKNTLGLGNVDNTSDANKPVSTAQAAALSTHNSDVEAHPSILADIADLYAIINYTAPAITTYVINGSNLVTIEKGASLVNPVLTWSLSGSVPNSQSIDQGVGAVPVGTFTKTVTGTFTTSTAWTLTVADTDPQGNAKNASATVNLNVRQKRYWGVSTSASLNSAGVLGLSNEFATSRGKSVTYDATGGRYIFYAYPASFGLPTVTVGGLSFSAWTKTDLSFTNASGFTEAYYVIRFNDLQNGAAIAVVFS
jgi:hypothetical protein